MQQWYLGRNKTRSWSIPTAVSDSSGLWEGIWENHKLKSKSLRPTQGACAQQRFDTRLCPRQPHHCPIPPIRGAPCSKLHQTGRGVFSRLLCGAEAPPGALCSLGPLPNPTPCLASKRGQRREHTSSCSARSLWEQDSQPCLLSSCLVQVNLFDTRYICTEQLAWLASHLTLACRPSALKTPLAVMEGAQSLRGENSSLL